MAGWRQADVAARLCSRADEAAAPRCRLCMRSKADGPLPGPGVTPAAMAARGKRPMPIFHRTRCPSPVPPVHLVLLRPDMAAACKGCWAPKRYQTVGETHPRARPGHSAAAPQPPGCLARALSWRLVERRVSARTQSVSWQKLSGQAPCKNHKGLRALQTHETVMRQGFVTCPGAGNAAQSFPLKYCQASLRTQPM